MSQIIYLNGPTSVGKTSVAKELQTLLEEPYLLIGIDTIIDLMPSKFNNWKGGIASKGFYWKEKIDPTGHPIQVIQNGPFAKKLVQTYIAITETIAKSGHNLIIDDVALGAQEFNIWKKVLAPFNVLYVGLTASLETIEQREKDRQDRMIGSGRHQASVCHEGINYDLMLKTDNLSPKKSAEQIISYLS